MKTITRQVRVYIAGPYSAGDVDVNVRTAIAAGERLWLRGAIPYIPHLNHYWHVLHPKEHHEWMRYDRYWLQNCDCLLRLPGESRGADDEIQYALALGKMIFRTEKDLVEYYAAASS